MIHATLDAPVHPLGHRARVLLASVFGPYAQDDQYGSRLLNPMELYHNQVTRVQRGFSFRTFHRSWGLMLIQANLQAPCTLLDFPSEARFLAEIKTHNYDVIGISAIIPNVLKVRRMCRLIRKHQPQATIVVGGHLANWPEAERYVGADHVVRGDGVQWMRRFLGEDERRSIRHPVVMSDIGPRIMGVDLEDHAGLENATLIPSVGCPKGCSFCSTSAMFGGKGRWVDFYRTGDELFELMCGLESRLGARGFFVMDENFLLNKSRALRLLELMEAHGKDWFLKIFGSADVLRQFSMEQLVSLGVAWVWLGLEGQDARYAKLAGTDTRALVRQLQSHGIRVLGSSIIGLEEHSPENIDAVIDHAVGHNADFHQFMLYTPIPGTPLYADLETKGRLFAWTDFAAADIHGQLQFNFRHPRIESGMEGEFVLRAFQRDFEINGPSVARAIRTFLHGWRRYRDHPNPRIRARFAHEARNLPVRYAAVLWAAREHFEDDPRRSQLIGDVLAMLYAECGPAAERAAPIAGRRLYRQLQQEEERLRDGWTYEPPTFYETNSDDGPAAAVRVQSIAVARPAVDAAAQELPLLE